MEQLSQAPSSIDSLQGEIQVAFKYLKELSMEEGVGCLQVALGQTQVHGEMGWWAGALSQETYTIPGSTSQHLDVLWQVYPLPRVQGVIQEGREMPCFPEQRQASSVGLYGRSGILPTTI